MRRAALVLTFVTVLSHADALLLRPAMRVVAHTIPRIITMAADGGDSDDAARRDALRLPDADAPVTRSDENDWDSAPAGGNQPDLLIPVIAVGSFAAFALIIANEYLTRGFCPPFLDTCINLLGGTDGGWGS